MCAYDNLFVNCTLSWLPSFGILCGSAEQVSLWKMGSCVEGNIVNNLAVLWVLLLCTELPLYCQNGFEVCRQFISCTDNGSSCAQSASISLIKCCDDCSWYIICRRRWFTALLCFFHMGCCLINLHSNVMMIIMMMMIIIIIWF